MPYIELNKQNFFHNLEEVSKKTRTLDDIIVVLKDNAYGHGVTQISKMCQEFGITKAIVRSFDEALEIKEYFNTVISLNRSRNSNYDKDIEIVINSLEDIDYIQSGSKVHLKVDTGMHRNGILAEQLVEAINLLLSKDIKIVGVMTHYRSADVLSSEYFWQKKNFQKIKELVKKLSSTLRFELPRFHSRATHSIFRENIVDDEMIRIGIGMYGYIDLPKEFNTINLKPVLSLWANKISTRKIQKGQRVGYGGAYCSKEEQLISTYDIGYADGFPRLNEHMDYCINKDKKILGRVSMDNISINSIDDKIMIFDNVNRLANMTKTINYDILAKLKPNINRIIV
jgi:alanine racemase